MSANINFRRGGQTQKAPHKDKMSPTWRIKVGKRPPFVNKPPPPPITTKRPPHGEKSGRKALL